MKTGYIISGAKRVAVHRILISPILSAVFSGQTPFFTHIVPKKTMANTTETTGGFLFPSRFAPRETRRSDFQGNSGPFRPDLSGKEAPKGNEARY
jgi:hypothetical protein